MIYIFAYFCLLILSEVACFNLKRLTYNPIYMYHILVFDRRYIIFECLIRATHNYGMWKSVPVTENDSCFCWVSRRDNTCSVIVSRLAYKSICFSHNYMQHVTTTRCVWLSLVSKPCSPALDHFELIDFSFIVWVPSRTGITQVTV